jgi:hypothetical protein
VLEDLKLVLCQEGPSVGHEELRVGEAQGPLQRTGRRRLVAEHVLAHLVNGAVAGTTSGSGIARQRE